MLARISFRARLWDGVLICLITVEKTDRLEYPGGMSQSEDVRRMYLEAMGIQVWQRHTVPVAIAPDTSALEPMKRERARTSPSADTQDWTALEQTVAQCTLCGLHTARTQTVFGVGNHEAQWLFIGEAPGAEEDRQGEPFVGRAGQLLNAMIFAIGLKREDVYIANVLKCRPPNNRDPQPNEVAKCEPYLIRQIGLIQPRLIVALGRHAAHSLLKTDLPLAKLRGQRLNYHGTPLVVTYHPAYLLRNPVDKRKAWVDLCLAKTVVETA
jgi:uracil-DNA glycosylase